MSLNDAVALVDMPEFIQLAKIDPTSETIDQNLIETLINSISQRFLNEVERHLLAASTTEIFSGNGTYQQYLQEAPITATITTLYYRSSFTATWQAFTGTFEQNNAEGRIYMTDGSVFGEGPDSWKCTYSYGYVRKDIPVDIKQGVVDLVLQERNRVNMSAHGIGSQSMGDKSQSYNFDVLPESWTSAVNNYKRYRL